MFAKRCSATRSASVSRHSTRFPRTASGGARFPALNGTPSHATAIAGSYNHSYAIQSMTGAVSAGATNDWSQATLPPSVNGTAGTTTAIAAGGLFTLVIDPPRRSCGLGSELAFIILRGRRMRKRE